MMQIKIKNFLITVIVIIIVLFVWKLIHNLISNKTEYLNLSPYETVNYIDDLYLSIDKDSYEKDVKEINIYIHNETSNEIVYGAKYSFEVYEDNNWYVVPYVNEDIIHSITDTGYILKANTTNEEILYLEPYKFKQGRYRYVKQIQDITMAVEFYIK
jgi:hypothetical protein